MQANRTPGPWYTMGAGVYTGSAQNDNIAHIATAHFYGVSGDPMANARLIAAAPDLLAALQEIVDHFRRTGDPTLGDMAPRARAAIARAIEPTDDQFMAALGPCGK